MGTIHIIFNPIPPRRMRRINRVVTREANKKMVNFVLYSIDSLHLYRVNWILYLVCSGSIVP